MGPARPYRIAEAMPIVTNARWAERLLLRIGLASVDILAIGFGFWLAYFLRFESTISYLFYQPAESALPFYSTLVFLLIPLWLAVFAVFQLYDFEVLFGGTLEYAKVFNACSFSMLLVIVTSFLYPNLVIARAWLLLSWILVTFLVLVGRFVVRRFVYGLRHRGRFLTSVLIIGANEEGVAVAEQLHAAITSGVWLAGFADNDLPEGKELAGGYRVLGSPRNLVDIVQRHGIQEIIIAASSVTREQLLEIFQLYGTSNDVVLRLSSGLFEIMTTGMQVREIGSVPLMKLNKVRLTGLEVFLKSILDYALASVGLILLLPVFMLIGLAIKLDSPGPIFYKRKVLGVGGKRFYAYKLRSMYVNADEMLQENEALLEEYLVSYKLKDDPRITRVGRFLRRGSLDELPQLFNVLRGEMSLIGPRMITEGEHDRYGKWKMNLLTVKPGISGLWQVRGRSDIGYEERVTLDMHYIRNYSIWLDLQILFQTLPKVLRRDGAY